MRRICLLFLAAAIGSVGATPPPPDAPFSEKVCRAESVVVGVASGFEVVGVPGCANRGDGKHLTMCEEVQVRVAVQEVLRAGSSTVPAVLTYRFGGGLFSVDELRTDLLSGPRYFFLAAPSSGRPPIFRTSYPWLLGAAANAENGVEVRQALENCPAPNNSSKPTPLRGAA